MLIHALMSSLHFVFAMTLVSAVVYEFFTFRKGFTLEDAKKIQKADAIYGLSAIMVLTIGFIRVYYFEKGTGYYFSNIFFILKLAAFSFVGACSIYPTIRFLKWKSWIKKDEVPVVEEKEYNNIRTLISLELVGLVIMIFCASMMAKGLGI